MPELVDVEGFRRVAVRAAGRTVEEVRVHDAGVLRGVSSAELADVVRGSSFRRPTRHGKWLILPVAGRGAEVLMHFGMTGSLHWCAGESAPEPHRHDRVEFRERGGVLRYRDMRKLTGIHLVTDPSGRRTLLGDLGPDAAQVDAAALAELLGRRERLLKAALMDQTVLAGLGNLLVDEILWRARLHPRRATTSLGAAEVDALSEQLRTVLRAGSRAGRVPPRPSWLTGHRDERDGRCPRRHGRSRSRRDRDRPKLRRDRIGGRTTVWCPECQPTP